MKKVLFTATVDTHIERFHLPYLKYFKDEGYEVHVATNTDKKIKYCDKKHSVSFERSPINTKNIKAIKQLRKIINEEKYDLIHTHTPMASVTTRIASIKARKEGTRVIYTAHGFHFFKNSSKLNWLLYYPIEKHLSKYTDELVTINKEDYHLAKRKFKTNVHYVPGVGIEEYRYNTKLTTKEKNKLMKELNITKKDYIFIQIGELNNNKNQIMSIKAIKEIIKENNKVKLLIVGSGTNEQLLKEEVKRLKLTNNINFLGYRLDVPELLNISNSLISTSYREGLPVNIIEAIANKIPVITTPARGSKDLVINNRNGYVIEQDNIKQLVNKMKLVMNKQLKLDTNIKQFTFNDIITKFDNIYKITKPIRVTQVIRAMNMGGAECLIMNLYRNIDRKKIQFDFIVSDKGIFDKEIIKLGGRIKYIPYLTKTGGLVYKKKLIKAFKELNTTIVHSHLDQVTGIVMKAAKKARVKKRIAHSHSTQNKNNKIEKIYKKYLQSKINKYATNFLACSTPSAKWLYEKNYNNAQIIKNAIETEKYLYNEKHRTEIRKELKVPKDCTLIGTVGAFRQEKNHKYLIDFFQYYQTKNNNSKLVLVGDGYLKEELIKLVNSYNLTKEVIFLGNRMDCHKILSALDTYICPSLYEGLSLSLIEAQYSGIRIIANTTVDKASDISNTIKFISMEEKNYSKIEKNITNKRSKVIQKELDKKGFNIKEVSKNLENYYLN